MNYKLYGCVPVLGMFDGLLRPVFTDGANYFVQVLDKNEDICFLNINKPDEDNLIEVDTKYLNENEYNYGFDFGSGDICVGNEDQMIACFLERFNTLSFNEHRLLNKFNSKIRTRKK